LDSISFDSAENALDIFINNRSWIDADKLAQTGIWGCGKIRAISDCAEMELPPPASGRSKKAGRR
jgi:hypothetical protein